MKPRTQTIIPPEGGWVECAWYLVDVSYNSSNPIHRSLFYTGFLNGGKKEEKIPGGYNALCPLIGPDNERNYGIQDIKYLKAIRLLITEDEAEK